MRWDSARRVPWQRFLKEAALFGAAMSVVFALTGDAKAGTFIGVAFGAVFYVLFSAVMAKFGHVRATLAEMRAAAALAQREKAARAGSAAPSRPRPAPTSRTGGGAPKKRK